MPRPAGRNGTRQVMATPNKQSPAKLIMNDDRVEKAARLQSRQALQEIHMNEIRAAASPMRKLNRNDRPRDSIGSSPATPQTESRNGTRKQFKHTTQNEGQIRNQRRDPRDLLGPNDGSLTPMKRVPVLANFEEWMKLATDNKINATNSWSFALIDYFNDMSLLKDGPGGQVNFQKASCTLDGCVKIYTSRVDSVATETGRLLSGLADSGNEEKKKRKGGEEGDEEGEDGEDDDDDEEGGKKKQKRKANRSHEATLAPSFASLQLKKLELEFAVDPLFKKASADFDEGGAKGLLLNHLSIDSKGRIVFDSSDDAGDATGQQQEQDKQHEEQEQLSGEDRETEDQEDKNQEIDLDPLATKFFPDLLALDSKDICPSMKTFTLGSADLSIPSIKGPENWKDASRAKEEARTPPPDLNLADQTGIFLDGSNGFEFDDDDDGALGGFDMPDNVGFGEGGEAWAKEGALEPMMQVVVADDENQIDGENTDGYAVSLQHRYREDAEQQSIMAYFDKAFNSRAKGKAAFNMSLENWRIQKIQKARQSEVAATTTTTSRSRKEKEPFEIDFNGPMSDNLKDLLAAPPVSNTTISLPRTQLKIKGRNLLDKDDEIVDVRAMMRLWTKPKCRIGRRKGGMQIIDEGFGSRSRVVDTSNERPTTADEDEEEIQGQKGDYDANFFADDDPLPFMFDGPLPIDDDDDDDGNEGGEPGFVDAREMLSPRPENGQPQLGDYENSDGQNEQIQGQSNTLFPASQMLPGSFGSQLVTQQGRRLRPEYVNYARTAKKVDVRALKENMWKGMSDRLIKTINFPTQRPPTPALTNDEDVDMMDVDEDEPPLPPPSSSEEEEQQKHPPTPPSSGEEEGNASGNGNGTLKFTNMISDLKSIYPEPQMKDISTSYCFIVLLHLANEKGLVLEGGREEGGMNEIMIRRDGDVGEGYVGE